MGEPDVDEGDPKNLSATRGVKSLFADDDEEEPMSAEKAISNKDKYLKELAMAYCFLLLITSRESIEPAKERKSFEKKIYSITKETTKILINLQSYSLLSDIELNRLFRGKLFCGTMNSRGFHNGSASKHNLHKMTVSKDLWGASKTGQVITDAQSAKILPVNSPQVARQNSKLKAKINLLGKLSSIIQPKADIFRKIEEVGKDQSAGSDGNGAREASQSTSLPQQSSTAFPSIMNVDRTVVQSHRISLTEIMMARSPLADAVLPPPQRFAK
ncbi:hypothetical protein HDU83_002710 [Entophlyctis luteolus]|nr:hypothetical protein HDU83_002710 [Entophlyctis luteolus]KAJ3393754.1 hypothetical protein HDU84_001161 [Entophlyctis sp. JEL0112]